MRRSFLVLVVLAVIAALSAYWIFLAPPRVNLVQPTRGPAAEVVYATGIVEPERWAKIMPMQKRRLIATCDCEGKAVTAGDELARQDDSQEQAAMTELLARREQMVRDLERVTDLYDRKVGTSNAVDQATTALKEIDARISAAKQAIRDLVLTSPIDGIVLRADFQIGEIVGGGDAVFWVGQPRPLQVVADVNEEDIAKVQAGQKVLLRHEGFSDDGLTAAVADITPKGDPVSKTFRAHFNLPDDTPLMIGMSVEANIIVREKADALLVPAEAVVNGAIYEVIDGRVNAKPVTLGVRGNRFVEILAGIKQDTSFISPIPSTIKPGDRVSATATAR
jgi:RND family efflux transporter MFP subunit